MKLSGDNLFFIKKQASSSGIDEEDLNLYGFRVIVNDDKKLHLSFCENTYLIISKERFKHKKEAVEFSKAQDLPLAPGAISLFLAIAGVCNLKNSFIREALAFNFPETPQPDYKSGIWAWSENDEDGAMLLWDGHDIDSDFGLLSVDEIKELFNIEPTLPAICGNFKL